MWKEAQILAVALFKLCMLPLLLLEQSPVLPASLSALLNDPCCQCPQPANLAITRCELGQPSALWQAARVRVFSVIARGPWQWLFSVTTMEAGTSLPKCGFSPALPSLGWGMILPRRQHLTALCKKCGNGNLLADKLEVLMTWSSQQHALQLPQRVCRDLMSYLPVQAICSFYLCFSI